MGNDRTKREAGLLVLVVFILGVLVGGVGYRLAGARVFSAHDGPSGHGGQHQGPPPRPLGDQLGLSADQQKQLDVIWADTKTQVQSVDAQRNAIRMQTRDKIRAILTADQLAKFNAMVKDMDSHNHGGDRGPGDRGPGGGPDRGPHPGPGF